MKKPLILNSKCKHDWQLSHTDWQFPTGYTGSCVPEEYAYFFCNKCLKVIKKKVTLLEELKEEK